MMATKTKADRKQHKQIPAGRQPVVVILGHVDHGKTTLLDFIRKSNVVKEEAGQITQSIGAYEIEHDGRRITFIDTPGHEAFKKLREKGARIADVALLVVAADQGAQEQTKEAWQIIQEAAIPCIAVFTKSDLKKADLGQAERSLLKMGVPLEGAGGGQVPHLAVSAKTGDNVKGLLDLILLVNELDESKEPAKEEDEAQAFVLTARLDQQKGVLASLIVQKGVFRKGARLYSAIHNNDLGKLRAMEDYQGKKITAASPGQPFLAIGFYRLPESGTLISDKPIADKRKDNNLPYRKYDIGNYVIKASQEEKARLKILIKVSESDMSEAVLEEFKKLAFRYVSIEIISVSQGDIVLNDINQAAVIGATVLGFRVNASQDAVRAAATSGVIVQVFDVIFKLKEILGDLTKKIIPRVTREEITGRLEVRAVFRQDKEMVILGGMVEEGCIKIAATVRVYREGQWRGEGKVIGLEKDKKKVKEVEKGSLCGVELKITGKPFELKKKDKLETFELVVRDSNEV